MGLIFTAYFLTLQLRDAFDGLTVRSELSSMLQDAKNHPFHRALQQKVKSMIDGTKFECEASQNDIFFNQTLGNLSPAELNAFGELMEQGVSFWPLIYVLWNGPTAGSNNFYPNKQQETKLKKRLRNLNDFWDIHTSNISLYSMNGQSFAIDANLVPHVAYLLDIEAAMAQKVVDTVQEVMAKYPAIGPNFPLWTYFGMAVGNGPAKGKNSIILGDGLLQLFESLGIGDAGPDFILFHEFGHHIQMGLDIEELKEGGTPEGTRYVELLADAYSAYFGHHPRGASFQTKRVLELSKAAFALGDCLFTASSHHGTPKQRARAVAFAVKLIDNVKGGKNNILKAATFKAKFDKAYAAIVAPDAA